LGSLQQQNYRCTPPPPSTHTHSLPNFGFSPGTLTPSLPPGAEPGRGRLRRGRGTGAALPGPPAPSAPPRRSTSPPSPKKIGLCPRGFLLSLFWPFSAELAPSALPHTHTHTLREPVRREAIFTQISNSPSGGSCLGEVLLCWVPERRPPSLTGGRGGGPRAGGSPPPLCPPGSAGSAPRGDRDPLPRDLSPRTRAGGAGGPSRGGQRRVGGAGAEPRSCPAARSLLEGWGGGCGVCVCVRVWCACSRLHRERGSVWCSPPAPARNGEM